MKIISATKEELQITKKFIKAIIITLIFVIITFLVFEKNIVYGLYFVSGILVGYILERFWKPAVLDAHEYSSEWKRYLKDKEEKKKKLN